MARRKRRSVKKTLFGMDEDVGQIGGRAWVQLKEKNREER